MKTAIKPETEMAIFSLTQKWFGDRYRPLTQALEAPEILSIDLMFATDYDPLVNPELDEELSVDVVATEKGLVAHGIGFWRRQLLTLFYAIQVEPKFSWYDEDWHLVPAPYPEGEEFTGFCGDLLQLLEDSHR